MHGVQVSDLHKPCTYALHHFPTCLQAFPPVGLPFKEVPRVQSVGAEFEEAAELAGWGGGPEGEFLHQGGLLVGDEGFELGVEGGKVRVGGDGVEGGVIAVVALVFPDVDYLNHQQLLPVHARHVPPPYQRYHNPLLPFSNCRPGGHGFLPGWPSGDTSHPPA